MKLQHVLLKIGLIDLNPKRMQDLIDASNVAMIHWAFENGRYDVRLMAVEHFSNRKDEDSKSLLKKAIGDSTEVVSQAAMSGLENVTDSMETHQMIAEKRQFWIDEKNYRQGRRSREHRKTSVMTESKERGSKKTLDNVRSMLKKPLNSGKWF